MQLPPIPQGVAHQPQAPPVAIASSTPGPAAPRFSALEPFGWKSLDGRVVRAEPPYLGTPSFAWGRFLVNLSVLGAGVYAVYYTCGAVLFLFVVLFILALWLLGKVFRGGFLTAVAVRVTSSMLTRRLTRPVASAPVRDYRVRHSNGQETLVRLKGQLVAGSVCVGDDVHVEGFERAGILLLRRGYNKSIRAAIRVQGA